MRNGNCFINHSTKSQNSLDCAFADGQHLANSWWNGKQVYAQQEFGWFRRAIADVVSNNLMANTNVYYGPLSASNQQHSSAAFWSSFVAVCSELTLFLCCAHITVGHRPQNEQNKKKKNIYCSKYVHMYLQQIRSFIKFVQVLPILLISILVRFSRFLYINCRFFLYGKLSVIKCWWNSPKNS